MQETPIPCLTKVLMVMEPLDHIPHDLGASGVARVIWVVICSWRMQGKNFLEDSKAGGSRFSLGLTALRRFGGDYQHTYQHMATSTCLEIT